MIRKLNANAHKGHWSKNTSFALLDRLADEVTELKLAVEEGLATDVMSEAVDVANFAMFIFDNYREALNMKLQEAFNRADGRCICPVCKCAYREHPYDESPENIGYDGPFLNKLCDGSLVKL